MGEVDNVLVEDYTTAPNGERRQQWRLAGFWIGAYQLVDFADTDPETLCSTAQTMAERSD